MTKQVNHVTELQLGADGKRHLPVLRPVDEELSYELRRHRRLYGSPKYQTAPFQEEIPKTRSECPQVRPCRFFCKHNTWVVSGLDQPGRRWVGTLQDPSDLPSTQVCPTIDHNCALDWAEAAHEKESVTPAIIAATLGISDRQARRYNAEAMAALPGALRDELEKADANVMQWKERG